MLRQSDAVKFYVRAILIAVRNLAQHVILSIVCFRHGLPVSSVRSVTWRSATNQRSSLTTTRRMLRAAAAADQSKLTQSMSASIAAGSLHREATWKSTCRRFMVLVTSKHFTVSSVQRSVHKKLISRLISHLFTEQVMPQDFNVTFVPRRLLIRPVCNYIWKESISFKRVTCVKPRKSLLTANAS